MAGGDWGDSRDPGGPSHYRGPPLARSRLRPIGRGGSPGYSRVDPALLRVGFQPRAVAPRPWPACGSSPGSMASFTVWSIASKLFQTSTEPILTTWRHSFHGRHRRLRHTWTVCNWTFRCRAAAAAAERTHRRHCSTRRARGDDGDYYFPTSSVLGNIDASCRCPMFGLRLGADRPSPQRARAWFPLLLSGRQSSALVILETPDFKSTIATCKRRLPFWLWRSGHSFLPRCLQSGGRARRALLAQT